MNSPSPLLVVKNRPGFLLLAILGTGLFSGLCLMNVFDAAPWPTATLHRYLGGFLALLAVPLCLASVAFFISGKPVLSASQDGITSWSLASTTRIGWEDIDLIEPCAIPAGFVDMKFVRIKLKPSSPLHAQLNWSRMRRLLLLLPKPQDYVLVGTAGTGRKNIDIALEQEQLRARFS